MQAAIAAAHDRAPSHSETDWTEILSIYGLLERITANPMVRLNQAVAAAMAHGPAAGLELVEGLEAGLGDHHRLQSVRAHLQEMAGNIPAAVTGYTAAAALTTNVSERHYLMAKAADLRHGIPGRPTGVD